MWPLCDFSISSALWLLGPLILGLLTAWWVWGGHRDDADAYEEPDAFRAPTPPPLSVPTGGATPTPIIVPVPDPDPMPVPVVPLATVPIAPAPLAAVAAIGLTAIGIPAAIGAADDLEIIKGIGPKLIDVLNGLGVHRFDQIANWTAGDVDKVDDHLAAFKGRIGQEEWIPQAKLLAAGNHSEWQRIYGAVGGAAAVVGAAAMTAIGIPAAVGAADDLLQVKGIGPKLNELLTGLGVSRFDQIAAWGSAEIAKVDEHLGTFKGRIDRDLWTEQAGLLARGAIAEFEAKFGKLDSENQ